MTRKSRVVRCGFASPSSGTDTFQLQPLHYLKADPVCSIIKKDFFWKITSSFCVDRDHLFLSVREVQVSAIWFIYFCAFGSPQEELLRNHSWLLSIAFSKEITMVELKRPIVLWWRRTKAPAYNSTFLDCFCTEAEKGAVQLPQPNHRLLPPWQELLLRVLLWNLLLPYLFSFMFIVPTLTSSQEIYQLWIRWSTKE